MSDLTTLADRLERAEANLDSLHSDLRDQECLMPMQDQWLTEARTTMEAAAVRLRKLDALEEAARSAVREIRGSHYQDPLIRTLCVVCGAADGSYPCSALVEADALADALGGTE